MRCKNFTFENFAQENGGKTLSILIKWEKTDKKYITIIFFLILIFQASTFNSQNVAQGQLNFSASHDGEMMTFRNSALIDLVRIYKHKAKTFFYSGHNKFSFSLMHTFFCIMFLFHIWLYHHLAAWFLEINNMVGCNVSKEEK